ncbi:hypothetical protein V8D89_002020 [Ganoderma adspersum]
MVDAGELDTVYFYGAFWYALTTGTDSQVGTLTGIHDSEDGSAESLARSDAVVNADSHEYFAENNPALP